MNRNVEETGAATLPRPAGAQQPGTEKREPRREPKGRASPWEWVVAGVSTLVVLAMTGFMLHEALAEPATPPRITLRAGTVVRSGDAYLVEIWARNDGRSTAASLRVEGELAAGDRTVETSEVTIGYLPGGSRRKAALWFTHDPAGYRLRLRPTGHDQP
jgi:uncharacterized protein (TIGR02588 family)